MHQNLNILKQADLASDWFAVMRLIQRYGMIHVTPSITLREDELQFDFVRASGPGGQHVNKAATAVQLRFDVINSSSLPDDVRERLIRLGGKRMSADGVLIIDARRYRTQEQNRRDAIHRLVGLVRRAAEKPQVRRPTKPTLTSKRRRLVEKRRRSEIKRLRRSHPGFED